MNQLWIFLPPEACQGLSAELPVQWVTFTECRTLSLGEGLRELPAAWELVLPVEAVTACAVQLPTQKARWLRQALPFAVEELLAERPNDMILQRALAQLYQQAGRVEDAVAQLDSLAESMLSAGKKEDAMVLINQILLMGPPNAEQYRRLLMQLQSG